MLGLGFCWWDFVRVGFKVGLLVLGWLLGFWVLGDVFCGWLLGYLIQAYLELYF